MSGPLPVTGWFTELLNPSTHQSAFVALTQNGDAPIEQTATPKRCSTRLQ